MGRIPQCINVSVLCNKPLSIHSFMVCVLIVLNVHVIESFSCSSNPIKQRGTKIKHSYNAPTNFRNNTINIKIKIKIKSTSSVGVRRSILSRPTHRQIGIRVERPQTEAPRSNGVNNLSARIPLRAPLFPSVGKKKGCGCFVES
jgi:hypothetical protein